MQLEYVCIFCLITGRSLEIYICLHNCAPLSLLRDHYLSLDVSLSVENVDRRADSSRIVKPAASTMVNSIGFYWENIALSTTFRSPDTPSEYTNLSSICLLCSSREIMGIGWIGVCKTIPKYLLQQPLGDIVMSMHSLSCQTLNSGW